MIRKWITKIVDEVITNGLGKDGVITDKIEHYIEHRMWTSMK